MPDGVDPIQRAIEKIQKNMSLTSKKVINDEQGYIFSVSSESEETTEYTVAYDCIDGWFCNCPHYIRKAYCKHMQTAAVSENIVDIKMKFMNLI